MTAWQGVKENWRPMLLVWTMATGLAIGFYNIPSFAGALAGVQSLKSSSGLAFPAVIGFVAGGVLPELARLGTGSVPKRNREWVLDTAYRGLVWVGLAVMVDIFYTFQARWFGEGIDPGTLARKTATDMFVFAPIVFVPYTVGMFLWRSEGFRPSAFFQAWTPRGWNNKVLPTYVPNICFWIPVLFAVYAMPTDLQYPMSALATACWSLLFTFIHRSSLADENVEAAIQPE